MKILKNISGNQCSSAAERDVRSEAFFGLAEFAFLLRLGGGWRFLAVGYLKLRDLKAAEEQQLKTHRTICAHLQKTSHSETRVISADSSVEQTGFIPFLCKSTAESE